MRHLSHAPAFPVSVEVGPTEILAESLLGGNAGRARGIEGANIFFLGLHNVPAGQRLAEAITMNRWAV